MTVHFKRPNPQFLTAVLFAVLTLIAVPLQALEMPPDVKQAFEKATVTEDDMLNGPGGARMILMEYMKKNWADVFDRLEEVAPTRTQKAVLIRASESLEAQEYFTFLKEMKQYREAGRLSAEEFDDVIFPSRYKADFLPYNYQNEDIQKFVTGVRSLVTPKWQRGIDKILSGEMMKHREELGTANGGAKFDNSLLLTPAAATTLRRKPSKSPSENNIGQSSYAMTNPSNNANYATTDNKLTERHWLLWIVLSIAAVIFLGWLFRRSHQNK